MLAGRPLQTRCLRAGQGVKLLLVRVNRPLIVGRIVELLPGVRQLLPLPSPLPTSPSRTAFQIMALQGKVAVVTGATGIVGEGIARAFLEAGATVVAPIREAGKEAGLRAALGAPPADRLVTPVDAYTTAEGSKQLARFVQVKYGAVVSARWPQPVKN